MRCFGFILLFLAACGGQPIDAVTRMEPRMGGGAVVYGGHSEYDGLAENEHTWLAVVDLASDGTIVDRKDRGEAPLPGPARIGGLDLGDGTRIDIVPAAMEAPSQQQVIRRLDGANDELWRVALPLETIADFCHDADGSLLFGGGPAQTSQHFIDGAVVVKVTRDGAMPWQVRLR